MLDDFKAKVKSLFGESKQFTVEQTEENDLIKAEKAIFKYTEGKLWPLEFFPALRQNWVLAFKKGKMDEILALRIL